MPRWFAWGTFKAKDGAGIEPPAEEIPTDMGWALENTILEVGQYSEK